MSAYRKAFTVLVALSLWGAAGRSEPLSGAGTTDVQVGSIIVNNNYYSGVRIVLYHADNLDNVFATWNFRGGERSYLDYENQRLILGGDWLIQVEFDNGVRSPRRAVARVSTYTNGTFECLARDIYSGK